MKWNVQEANRKTGQYRTVTVDAPDRTAAEALGKYMGLSVADVTQVQQQHAVQNPPNAGVTPFPVLGEPAPHRSGTPMLWMVMITVATSLVCTSIAIWVMNPFKSPVAETPALPISSEDGELDRVKNEAPEARVDEGKVIGDLNIKDADDAKAVLDDSKLAGDEADKSPTTHATDQEG